MAVPFLPTPTQHSGRDHPAFSAYGRPGDRFENIGPGVDEFHERTGEGSTTWDLCENCAPDESGRPSQNFTDSYQNLQHSGATTPSFDREGGEPYYGPAPGGGVVAPLPYFSRDEEGGVDMAELTCTECGTGIIHEGGTDPSGARYPSTEYVDGRLASQQWLHR